ncbi:MAG: hypothetical protein KKH52_03275 [Nanoarchaeota archaeon]|nr:hypothetical protein [Nanoarchaeota archaeon]MBU1623012.1 hypothetical protein [Nanoarchaeota archaeon]MBU1974389.1 hypothetical protein [Nanoarchaeota archaeon]
MPSLLEGLVEKKTLAIFTILIKNHSKLFHLNSLAAAAKVPVSSTARIIKGLVKHNFASEIKIGKISVYKLADNQKIKKITGVL